MKKALTMLLLIISVQAIAQTYPITGITISLPANPDASRIANGAVIKETDILKGLTFRWTPIVPKPKDPVTYRVRVWQLMQGQNGTQAMKANQPIITKDVDNFMVTISSLTSGPCKAPYLCSFIWNVQALDREGKPVGGNNVTSEASSFSISQPGTNTIR